MNAAMRKLLDLLEREGPLTMGEVVKRSGLKLVEVYQTLGVCESEHRAKRTGQLWSKLPGYAGANDHELVDVRTHNAPSDATRRRQGDRIRELI